MPRKTRYFSADQLRFLYNEHNVDYCKLMLQGIYLLLKFCSSVPSLKNCPKNRANLVNMLKIKFAAL